MLGNESELISASSTFLADASVAGRHTDLDSGSSPVSAVCAVHSFDSMVSTSSISRIVVLIFQRCP
jgi:hypothetical protein